MKALSAWVEAQGAELVWSLTERFTQEQTARAMGWNNRVDVARHKALKVLKDAGAWDEIIVPTFKDMGTEIEDDEGTANVPTGTKSVFTERLLREILDLTADQQAELCGCLANGARIKKPADAPRKTPAGFPLCMNIIVEPIVIYSFIIYNSENYE